MVKNIFIVIGILLLGIYIMLWTMSIEKYPVRYGVSFSKNYALDLKLDWKEAYAAILTDLKPEYIRLGVEWSDVEKERGVFDFTDIDFMMNEAEKNNTKVLLAIGQKVPRWPECYYPRWYHELTTEQKTTATFNYLENTVSRFKDHPALELWQVENEPYISFDFGECDSFNRDIVTDEIALVKKNDPLHKTITTDSGETSFWYDSINAADIFGTTMYRAVTGPMGLHFYYNWMPPGFFKARAYWQGRTYSDFYISELQGEPWFAGTNALETPIEEQEKTMNTKRLQANMDVAERTGASRAYLWGTEWWYFMKEKKCDARYWELVKEKLTMSN